MPDGRTVTVKIEAVSDNKGSKRFFADVQSEADKTAKHILAENKKLDAQLAADQKKALANQQRTDDILARSAKQLADVRIREAKRAAKEFEQSLNQPAASGGILSSLTGGGALSGFAGGVAGGALFAGLKTGLNEVIGLTETAATKLFDMAKDASDVGRSLAGFSTVTGFNAKSSSAFAYALSLIGKNLNDVQRPMVYFARQLDAAQHGSEKAQAALQRLGITKFDNLEEAFDQATKAVTGTSNTVERLGKVTAGFGARGGTDIAKAMFKMKGDFLGFIETAERLGVTLSEDDVKAAKKFGHEYETVMYQAKLAATKFALAYADDITGAMDTVSKKLAENKNAWHSWGTTTGHAIMGVWNVVSSVTGYLANRPNLLRFIVMMNPLSAAGYVAMSELINSGAGGSFALTPPTDRPDIKNDPRNPFYQASPSAGGGGTGSRTFWGHTYQPKISSIKKRGGGRSYADSDAIYDENGEEIDAGDFSLAKKGKGGGSGHIHRAPKESDAEFKKFFTDQGFHVNRTFGKAYNEGSPHPYGGAADISITGKTGDQIFALMVKSLEKGYRVFDERTKAPGVWQSAPHVHVENAKTTLTKPSRFVNMGFTPDQLAYLQHLDKERLGKVAGTDVQKDVGDFLSKQSDLATAADKEKFYRGLIEIYKSTGIMPTGETLDEIHALMVKDVQKQGLSTFGMSAEKTARSFHPTGILTSPDYIDFGELQKRETSKSDQQFLDILKELDDTQFSLNEHTEEEILLRKIQLNQYPELTENDKNLALAKAKLIDNTKAQKKADEDAKEAAEKYADEQKRVFEQTEDFFRNKLDALVNGGPKALWKQMLQDFKNQFVDKAANMLAQMFSGARGGQITGQGAGGPGFGGIFNGIFGSIFGGGGGGQGPGGTPYFNPGNNFAPGGNVIPFPTNPFNGGAHGVPLSGGSSAGWEPDDSVMFGSHGGGLRSNFLNQFFGPRKNLLTGKMSTLGGRMGGIGDIAAMAGSFVPGRGGRVLSYAGMGASIGSMFGPWGAAIGAGAGALFGLFGGHDNAIEKLKQAAASEFGISVKDKSVLASLKNLGEGMFGKGKVGANAVAVVHSEEGMNILRAYAESSGQSGLKIDRLNYGDPNWSGNNFRSSTGGYRASTPSSSPRSGGGMMEVMERVHTVLDRLEAVDADKVVAMGAKKASQHIADAYESELENDGYRAERMFRRTGARN